MNHARLGYFFVAALTVGTCAPAARATATSHPASAAVADPFPHPVLPEEPTTWPRVMLQIAAGLFVAAAVLGPIIRRSVPQDTPPATHSHDEPPGGSGQHGQSGLVEPDAPDRPKH